MATITGSFDLNARLGAAPDGPGFTLDAGIGPHWFTIDAVTVAPATGQGWAFESTGFNPQAFYAAPFGVYAFTVDALIAYRHFHIDALITLHASASFTLQYRTKTADAAFQGAGFDWKDFQADAEPVRWFGINADVFRHSTGTFSAGAVKYERIDADRLHFTLDAWMARSFTADAVIHRASGTKTFTISAQRWNPNLHFHVDAVRHQHFTQTFTIDARTPNVPGIPCTFIWPFTLDAIKFRTLGGSFKISASINANQRALYLEENRAPIASPADRALYLEENRAPIGTPTDRALYLEENRAPIGSPADRALYLEENRLAVTSPADRAFYVFRNQITYGILSGARGFYWHANVVKGGSFQIRARIHAGDVGHFSIDAWIVGTRGSFTIDAETEGHTKTRAFTIDAFMRPVGPWHRRAFFSTDAVVAQGFFRIYAWVPRYFKADAVKRRSMSGSFTIAAAKDRHFHIDAIVRRQQPDFFTIDALIARGRFFIDAQVTAPRRFTLDAWKRPAVRIFTIDAWRQGRTSQSFAIDAVLYPLGGGTPGAGRIVSTFTVGAYVQGTNIIIWPDDGGQPTDQLGNPPPPSRSFRLKIEAGIRHPELFDATISAAWYAKVTEMQHYVNTYLRIPAEKRTAAQNAALATDLATLEKDKQQFFATRECPVEWVDYTGHCVWNETTFTQQAKTSPGTFQITLRGVYSEFKGGEEIHVEVDDRRIFGGYVMRVERGYFFEAVGAPKTVLYGVDYNALFDFLRVYNRPITWENFYLTEANGGGYDNWPWYPKGTMDQKIILETANTYVDMPYALSVKADNVDALDTPVPVAAGWVMPEAGSPWRDVLQSIVQITSGVFWISAYQDLEYHSRSQVTAPAAITDGAGGISCRNLVVSTDLSSMVNDATVWGTLAQTVSGSITFDREVADGHQAERFWLNAVNRMQGYVNTLLAIPASQRTAEQNHDLAIDQKTLAYDKEQLAIARANPGPDYIAKYGRWQQGEWRQDQHHQDWITKRAQSIIARYGVPIVKAECTIFEPGFQAGMVVQVKSRAYDMDTTLVIHRVQISFAVSQGAFDGKYYAVPRYDLSMGLDPEAPWQIYDYLPYPNVNEL